ncbi:MAG: PAS-domain containing protein [Rhizobiaceae bacterium]
MPAEYPSGAGRGSKIRNGWRREARSLLATDRFRDPVVLRVAALGATIATCLAPASARAQGSLLDMLRLPADLAIATSDVIEMAIFTGAMGSALVSAIWLIRERARIAAENVELRGRIAELDAAVQRSDAFLNLRDQKLVIWGRDGDRPEVAGSLAPRAGAPEERSAFLAFGRWLSPRSAAELEHAIAALRSERTHFDLITETRRGELLEVQGRVSSTHAIVRFLSVSEAQRAHADLKIAHRQLVNEQAVLRGLIEALPMPFWQRNADNELSWVNRAYVEAVDTDDAEAAIEARREFLGTQARDAIAARHSEDPVFQDALSTVIGGDRRMFAVTDVRGSAGSAGLAVDISETEALRDEMRHLQKSHSETLDQLTTAVAIFDSDEKLRFYNQAFQKLWDLDTGFLESAPDNALFIDRLRSDGKLPEQPEWRRWLENVLSAYRAVDPQEHWWHLPDGQTLRVIANPHPRGGVTWVFENLTEKIDLESRYKTAVRVQGETLDNLAEGVAVFGSDGRLQLSNPAFASLWGLVPDLTAEKTHISAIRTACDPLAKDSPWEEFVAAVTGFDDERRDRYDQIELKNGTVLRSALNPLPNGQVMLTFVDVTDSVNVERALKDKNEALQRTDRLKNDFVQHVSYELRSPLTNIIGFTELLDMESTGPLNERQRDYVGHIGASSAVLLTIVNDILDLATVDAGIMRLEIGEVQVEETINAASKLVAKRMAEHRIALELDVEEAPATFLADGNRVRQVLYNLLVNAANYAPEDSTVTVGCRQVGEVVEFNVHDDGPGIPAEALEAVFKRFEPVANGGRRRGAGLGLSIVKGFVELHGGSVAIETSEDTGTTVTCRFPVNPGMREAAE